MLDTHHHSSTGAGTLGKTVADVPSGLSLSPPRETKKKILCSAIFILYKTGLEDLVVDDFNPLTCNCR
jgi:hypothetical protein